MLSSTLQKKKRFGHGRTKNGAQSAKNFAPDGRLKRVRTAWIYELVESQTVVGSFDALNLLPKLVPQPITELKRLAEHIDSVPIAIQERVLATTLTVLLLETRAANDEILWKQAALTAEAWLQQIAPQATLNGKGLHEAAEQICKGYFIDLVLSLTRCHIPTHSTSASNRLPGSGPACFPALLLPCLAT